VRCSSI